MDYPPVTVVMTTYFMPGESGEERMDAAEYTLASWEAYLQYDGQLHLHVADDGTDDVTLWEFMPTKMWDNPVYCTRQNRRGVGTSLNAGFEVAEKVHRSPLIFYAVDDWALENHFNITPWARILLEREDVGMVRLGPPHPNTRGVVEMFTEEWQGWGLRLNKYSYVYAQRPALYHRRFTDAYGLFPENCSALECERIYSERVNSTAGPDVVLALPHPWKHIDTPSLSGLHPE